MFELVDSLGPGPELLWDALNPHTRNYLLRGVLAAVTAAVTSIRLVYPVVALVVASAVVSWGVLELVYAGFDRPRPEEVLGPGQIVLEGNSWGHLESFPSGHMAITTALAAAIALAFPRLRAVLGRTSPPLRSRASCSGRISRSTPLQASCSATSSRAWSTHCSSKPACSSGDIPRTAG